ncbi:cytochrome P450/oxidoreductase [uncultured Sulfitobacter sp.]|uniref:cytochrome P450/oxidoreductase n=1 Tax=uncultured Sulfitobacter sp. TaxID=191468 RepID=UPI00261AF14F|nr:cytochrome P450/oxidoreductase [uncultured Sulfitobacter sp.]
MKTPSLDIDFYSDDVILDPYPVYAQMREMGAVVYLPRHDMYALPRYNEVSEVLRQPLRFVSSRGVSPIQKVNDILVGSTLNSDPPEHDRTRAVTSEPLLPGALKDIEPLLVSSANGLIDTLCQRGEFDAIADFAQFLPVTIVAELVGLPVDSDQMLKWASATFNLFGTENARTDQAFKDLTNLRDFLLEYGRPEKLKDGGWAKRIFEVGPERGISYETCAQLMRDYINPSLDTTISTTGQIIKFFADHPDQWDLIRKDASLIPNAVEEAVRMATPIRAFTRYTVEDSTIAGHTIPADKRVIVIYASANRDHRKFPDPDRYDVTRDVHDHLGFGQGVHMCMGMHLARREIILLIEALRRRVTRFELLSEPVVAMNNTIRAFASMPVKVHLAAEILQDDKKETTAETSAWLDVTVAKRTDVATDIIGLELVGTDGSALPAYDAGAHVDVYVKSGLIRQYSLTGNPADRSKYRLGILLDPKSRGGSTAVHTDFTQGQSIRIGRPRNNFPMVRHVAHTVLFAGGIGITPMLNMAYALEASGASWEMHYCGRTADRLAFMDELAQFGSKVQVHIDTGLDDQKMDINAVLSSPAPDHHLYVCGPNGFINFIVQSAESNQWAAGSIHLERFGAEVNTDGAAFTVVARRSGKTFDVQPGETISQKLLENGIHVRVSCQSGVCGTCLTAVVEGMPDHRDLVQTDLEKASNTQITVCCSRSKTKKLVLDL